MTDTCAAEQPWKPQFNLISVWGSHFVGQWLFFCELDAASKSPFNHQYVFVERGKQVGFLLLGVLHCGGVVRGIFSLFKIQNAW